MDRKTWITEKNIITISIYRYSDVPINMLEDEQAIRPTREIASFLPG